MTVKSIDLVSFCPSVLAVGKYVFYDKKDELHSVIFKGLLQTSLLFTDCNLNMKQIKSNNMLHSVDDGLKKVKNQNHLLILTEIRPSVVQTRQRQQQLL